METTSASLLLNYLDSKRHEQMDGSLHTSHQQDDGFIQDNTLQIVLAVAAALLCSITLVACAICYRARKNALRRKSILSGIMLGLDGPSPFSVTLNGQLVEGSSRSKESYQALDIVEEHPQIDLDDLSLDRSLESPLADQDVQCSSFEGTDNATMTNVSFDEIKTCKKLKMMRHSQSMGNILQDVSSYRSCDVIVNFNLDYDSENSVFRINLHNVSDLPLKAQMTDIYAKCFLFPTCNEGKVSSIIKGDEVVFFDEMFHFENISRADLDVSTLRLAVYTRSKKKGKTKDNFIAECFLKLSNIDWSLPTPIEKEMIALRKRLKKQSTADKLLIRALGELFVLLQYQSMANRMKVFIRRAQNLPKSDRLLGQPVHYVRINLLNGDKVIQYKETRTQSGSNPVWNEPFLFDIPSTDIDKFSFELVVMRGRLYSKDDVVGHVIIGPGGTKAGIHHWTEILRPRAAEIAKWHHVLPVFKY